MYRNHTRNLIDDNLKIKLVIFPSIIAIAIFVYGFIVLTGYASLTKWYDIKPNFDFNGLRNYIELFKNDRFLMSVRNIIGFTTFFMLSCTVFGMILALILDQKLAGSKLFQSIFLFPMAISIIVSGVVWRWLLNPSTGINLLMQSIGFKSFKPEWYTSSKVMYFKPEEGLGYIFHKIGLDFILNDKFGISIGIFSLVIAATWQFSGYSMAVFLSALKTIPVELREASIVDGASEFEHTRYIVMPLIKRVSFGVLIILGHISLKIYDLVSAMTGTGAGYSTDVPAYFMVETAFKDNKFSTGAASAIVILIMVSVLSIPYIRSLVRRGDISV